MWGARTVWLVSCISTMLGLFCVAEHTVNAQSTNADLHALPSPTGSFNIATVTLDWKDETRLELLSPNHDPRELVVHIWYPAEKTDGPPAEYLNLKAFEDALGENRLRREFKSAYDPIRDGKVRTHATVGAPFMRGVRRNPLLLFSPGGGMVPELYTSQLEDLASHGYVVAAITHPYDAMLTLFPDGRRITGDSKRWPSSPSFPEENNLNQLKWHTADIRFVLDELIRADHDTSIPFAGHLDFNRVGAFGHSFGGEAAAQACQADRRLLACLNQDGLEGWAPYHLDPRGWGMDQAFMLIQRSPPTEPPSAEELAAMKLTLAQAEEIVARLKAYEQSTLQNTGKGSYQVLIDTKRTTHMSFSDLPLLQASGLAEAGIAAQVSAVVRSYTLAFFDKTLKGTRAPLLEGAGPVAFVDGIRQFKPGKPTRRP
jgi:hypothetical protein